MSANHERIERSKVRSLLDSFLCKRKFVKVLEDEDKKPKEDAEKASAVSNVPSTTPVSYSDVLSLNGNSTQSSEKKTCTDPYDSQAFYDRVETFNIMTWLGKPAELSPLVCARYGWQNTEQDLLQCVSCRVIVSGQLPAVWDDNKLYHSCCKKLENRIQNAHEKACKWLANPSPEAVLVVDLFNKRDVVQHFLTRVRGLCKIGQYLPEMALLTLAMQDVNQDVLECVVDEVKQSVPSEDLVILQRAVTLALCGWKVRTSNKENSVLTCDYCRRHAGVWNYGASVDTDCDTSFDSSTYYWEDRRILYSDSSDAQDKENLPEAESETMSQNVESTVNRSGTDLPSSDFLVSTELDDTNNDDSTKLVNTQVINDTKECSDILKESSDINSATECNMEGDNDNVVNASDNDKEKLGQPKEVATDEDKNNLEEAETSNHESEDKQKHLGTERLDLHLELSDSDDQGGSVNSQKLKEFNRDLESKSELGSGNCAIEPQAADSIMDVESNESSRGTKDEKNMETNNDETFDAKPNICMDENKLVSDEGNLCESSTERKEAICTKRDSVTNKRKCEDECVESESNLNKDFKEDEDQQGNNKVQSEDTNTNLTDTGLEKPEVLHTNNNSTVIKDKDEVKNMEHGLQTDDRVNMDGEKATADSQNAEGESNTQCMTGNNDTVASEPPRKRFKSIMKEAFDPLVEHRQWCPWINCYEHVIKSARSAQLTCSSVGSMDKSLNVSDVDRDISGSDDLLDGTPEKSSPSESEISPWKRQMYILCPHLRGTGEREPSLLESYKQGSPSAMRAIRKIMKAWT